MCRCSEPAPHRGTQGVGRLRLDSDDGVLVDKGRGDGDVRAGDERGVNNGAGVSGGGTDESDPGAVVEDRADVVEDIADDDGDPVRFEPVGLDGGAGESDVPLVPDGVFGVVEVDQLLLDVRMLMGAGGGGVSTPPGIIVDIPGAGVHGVSDKGGCGIDMLDGV